MLLIAAVCLGATADASAFQRPEHEWLSRRALCIVLVKTERDVARGSFERGETALEVLRALIEGGDGPPDYGQLVAYADYVTFPNEMIDTSRTGAERISTPRVQRRMADIFAVYTELLRNPHHFRELGLSQFHIWHDTAVARASDVSPPGREADPLYDALAYNAYADHFLEDFFAPGHMTRDPDGISHMGNLRNHDTDNWTGRTFEPSQAAWGELGPLLGETPEERAEAVSRCFPPRDRITLADAEEAVAPLSVGMKGDRQVYRDGEGLVEGRQRQAVFVVLAVARSVDDVVQSYLTVKETNGFPNRRCPALPPDAEWLTRATIPDDCYFVFDEDEEHHYLAGTRLGAYLSEPDASRSPLVWPTLGLSTELQRIDGTSRWQTSLELLFDLPSQDMFHLVGLTGDWTKHFSFELGTGYSYVNKGALEGDSDYDGHGPDLRLYLRAKQLYMFASAEVGWRFYHGRGQNENNFRAAGRLGFGNGIFWAYASLARDERLSSTGSESDWTAVGFGVSVTLPSTRVFGRLFGY